MEDQTIENSILLRVIEEYIHSPGIAVSIKKQAMLIKDKWERKLQGTVSYNDDGEHINNFKQMQ